MSPADASHRHAWDHIPWVVGGSADDTLRRQVLAHVADCPSCRDEYLFQCQVRDGLLQAEPPALSPDAGLQRLWQRVDAEATAAAPPDPVPVARPTPAANAPHWTRWLVSAVVVQAVALVLLAGQRWQPRADADTVTLSSPVQPASVRAELRVAPAAALTLGAWQAMLAGEQLRVVEVSADGRFYGLAREAGSAPLDDARLARLRSLPQLQLVEPVQP